MSLQKEGKKMTIELKRLIEERAQAVTAMHDLVAKAESEERGLTAEERESWDKMNESIESYDDRIERAKKAEDLFHQLDEVNDELLDTEDRGDQRDEGEVRSEAFSALLRSVESGLSGLSDEHRHVVAQMQREARAQSVGTTTAGGFLVPENFANRIIDGMAVYGGIRDAATVITTSDGGDMPFQTNDDTGNSGALLAENTQDSEQDLTFGEITLGAYKYTSKIIRVSVELMQDSAFDLDAYIAGKFAERLGRITSAHYATGTGSSQPNGIVTASTLGKTAAATAAITYNEMLDLKHSVDPAYRRGARWAFHDSTLKALKQLQDSNGLPLWSPNVSTDAPAMLDGDPYVIDNGIPQLATGNKTVIYGDLTKYHIRDVRGITMVRLVERYADYHQVGFIAFMRTDADLLDTSAVKHLIQA